MTERSQKRVANSSASLARDNGRDIKFDLHQCDGVNAVGCINVPRSRWDVCSPGQRFLAQLIDEIADGQTGTMISDARGFERDKQS